jgi:replication factor A2
MIHPTIRPSTGMDYQGGGGGGFGGVGMAGGGFGGRGGGNSTGSPPTSANKQRKAYGEQTCLPVTITMCHQARTEGDDSGIALSDGRPLHHVKLVAAIRSFAVSSTSCIFQVEDGTGLIDVKQWLDSTTDCTVIQELRQSVQKEHVYVSIIGQIKEYDGKKTIVADAMREVVDANELTYHMLEVVYEGERVRKQSAFISNEPPTPMQGIGFGGNSFPSHRAPIQPSFAANNGGNGLSQELTRLVREEGSKSEAGVTIGEIVTWLRNRHSETDIRNEIQNLTANGILYSTVNEESFKVA